MSQALLDSEGENIDGSGLDLGVLGQRRVKNMGEIALDNSRADTKVGM